MSKTLMKQKDSLFLDEYGVLCRKHKLGVQIVLPLKHHRLINKYIHCGLGHFSTERTLALAKQRVYFPRMESNIKHYIRNKCKCKAKRLQRRKPVAPLISIRSKCPLDLVHLDFLKLEKARNGAQYIVDSIKNTF